MRCPYCNSRNTNIIDSRPNISGTRRTRRCVCHDCGERFTTIEIYREDYIKAKDFKHKIERIGEILIRGE